MPSLGDLFITVGADIAGFKAAMGDVNDALKDASREVKAATSGWKEAFSSLQTVGLGMTAAITAPLVGIGLAAVTVSEQINMARLSFTTMLGSAEAAGTFLDKLKSFAAATPFEFPDLVTAAKRMMAMGFEAGQVVPTLRIIGDSVAALGGGAQMIDRVTLALGQMQAKGKVSAQEMNQLAENGIPAWQLLADKIGKSIPEAMKLAEKGAISAAIAVPAILEGMNDKFAGQMQKASQTLTGVWSNFKDPATFVLGDIGSTLAPILKNLVLNVAMPLLNWANDMSKAFAAMSPTMQTVIIGLAGIAAAAGPVLLVVGTLGQAFIGVQAAIAVLGPIVATIGPAIGLLAGPFGIAVAAVAALGVAAYEVYKNWADVKPVLMGLWTDISGAVSAIFGPVVAFLTPVFSGIATVWTSVWTAVRDFLGTVWASVAEMAKGIWDWIVNKINFALEQLGKLLPSTAAALKSWGTHGQEAAKGAKAAADTTDDLTAATKKVSKAIGDGKDATKEYSKALKAAESTLKVSKSTTEDAEKAYQKLFKAWQNGEIDVGQLSKAYAELQKKLVASGDAIKSNVTPQWIALGQAQELAKRGNETMLKAIGDFLNAGQSWGQKIKLVAIEHDNLGFSMKGSALEAANLAKEMQILTGKYPPVAQAVVNMNNAIKGSVLETAAIMKDMGATSTATLRTEADKLGQSYERIIQLNRENKATTQDVQAAYEKWTDAERAAAGITTTVTQERKKGLQEISTIVNDLAKNIADSIIHWKGFGEAAMTALESIGEAIVRNIIEKILESTKIVDKLVDAIGTVLSKIPGLGDIFGSGASAAGKAASGAGSAAGGAASGAGGAASAGTAAAGSGFTAIAGLITGAISAVSGVIGNFQFMGMNKSLDILVLHTLQTANDLANLRRDEWDRETHLFNKLDDWRQFLQLQMDTLIQTVRSGGDWLFELTSTLQSLDLSGSMALSGAGAGGITIDLRGATFLNDRQRDEILEDMVRRLKARNA